jgi:transglutaminase-like putative cysteine protease
MTAIAAPGELRSRSTRPISLAPVEGWLTLVLVAVMAGLVAWSIDDGRWILGRGNLTDFLVPVSIGGVLVSFVGVKLGLRRWTVHLLGAVIAALVIPILSASLLRPDSLNPFELYRLAARVLATVWTDFAVLHKTTTLEFGHYMLVFGVAAWGTGQFAGYAVFGHRRPFDAALVLGLILLLSMAINEHDQLVVLIGFSVAALLLMNRNHALEERTKWLHSRIGDPGSVRTAYLRGGALFVGLAVLGAMALTATARSAPLQAVFADLPQRIVDVSQAFQRFLPTGGSNRSINAIPFGSTLPIANRWGSQDGTAFTVLVPAGETERLYWRAVVYQRFDLNSWTFGNVRGTSKAVAAPLLKGLADDAQVLPGRRAVTVTVRPDVYRGDIVMAPQTIVSVDRPSTLNTIGAAGFFASVNAPGGGPYTLTASIPLRGDGQPGALTKNRLRAAGTDYPAEIRALYLDTPDGALGPSAEALLERIRTQVAGPTPYDTAAKMVDFFRNPANFSYDTDLRDVACDGVSTVECFAKVRRGFCQWYATTMTILLRELGIPARYVEGFLPGSRANGVETVLYSSAHAWVEAYFPSYGWVEFDPTGGGVARDVPLPSGEPVPDSTLDPNATFAPINEPNPGDEAGGDGTGATDGGEAGAGSGPFIFLALALAAGVLAVAIRSTLRGPRGEVGPDQAWRGVTALAARFGLGPRPAQTVFEYAGMLGEAMPGARVELATVANAKVEVAYGRRTLGEDRLAAVRDAHRRLRLRLLRLALRGRLMGPRRPGSR